MIGVGKPKVSQVHRQGGELWVDNWNKGRRNSTLLDVKCDGKRPQ